MEMENYTVYYVTLIQNIDISRSPQDNDSVLYYISP